MRTYRLARIVSFILFVAALIYLVGGFAFGIRLWSRGLGDGWGSGFAGWLSIPIFIGAFFGALTLLMFGVLLYFLTAINHNLTIVRQSGALTSPEPEARPAAAAPAPPAPRPAPPGPAPAPIPPLVTVHQPAVKAAAPAAEVAAPTVEATAPTVEVTAPAAEVTTPAVEVTAPAAEVTTPAVEAAGQPTVVVSPELLAELPEGDTDATPPPDTPGRLPGAEQAARIASELAAAKSADEPAS